MEEDLVITNRPGRTKSSHRLLFEAQVDVIKREIGELEDVRASLGLSKRKIAQLLMVDPSAWTRWTKQNEDAPPHIYRALQWFLLINQKYPGLGTPYWLSSRTHGSLAGQKDEKNDLLKEEIKEVKKDLQKVLKNNADNEKPMKPRRPPHLLVLLAVGMCSFCLGYLLK